MGAGIAGGFRVLELVALAISATTIAPAPAGFGSADLFIKQSLLIINYIIIMLHLHGGHAITI